MLYCYCEITPMQPHHDISPTFLVLTIRDPTDSYNWNLRRDIHTLQLLDHVGTH